MTIRTTTITEEKRVRIVAKGILLSGQGYFENIPDILYFDDVYEENESYERYLALAKEDFNKGKHPFNNQPTIETYWKEISRTDQKTTKIK